MARGHDVSLLPIYTPTRTDEPNVSEERVFFGGISVYLRAARAAVPADARDPRQALGLGPGDPAWPAGRASRSIRSARRADGLDAAGRGRLPAQGGAASSSDCLERPAAVRRRRAADTLLLGLAPPLARPRRPVVCTLQARTCSWRAWPSRYRAQSLALIRQHAPVVDALHGHQRLLRRLHGAATSACRAERMHTVPLGITSRAARRRARPRARPFTVGYFARVAPEKGLHLLAEAYRVLRRERRLPAARLEAAGYLAPEHQAYLGGRGGLARVGTARRVPLPRRRSTAPRRSRSCGPRRAVGAQPLRGAEGALPARGDGQRRARRAARHGAFPEIMANTGGGLLFEPGDVRGLADGHGCTRPAPRRRAGPRAARPG